MPRLRMWCMARTSQCAELREFRVIRAEGEEIFDPVVVKQYLDFELADLTSVDGARVEKGFCFDAFWAGCTLRNDQEFVLAVEYLGR
jgi:hypothetical protein